MKTKKLSVGSKEKRGSYIERSLRYFYLRFVRLRCSDVDVAKGVALGVFIGITPTMGIQLPLALFFAVLLKENKLAAMIGVFITNPVTVIPIYSFNFVVGKFFLSTPNLEIPHLNSLHEIFTLGRNLLIPLIFGSCIVGIVSAGIAYIITLNIYGFISSRINRRSCLDSMENK